MLVTNLAILVLAGFVGFDVISKVPEHAAHAADVGHERDPRHRDPRRPASCSAPARTAAPSTRSSSSSRSRSARSTSSAASSSPTACSRCSRAKPAPKKDGEEADVSTALATAFFRELDFINVLLHRRVHPVHLRADGADAARAPPCAATGSPPSAWRSPSSRRSCSRGDGQLGPDHRSASSIGTAVGVPAARQVKMTAMPQMVALFNGVGGGAVALIAWVEFSQSGGFDGYEPDVRRSRRCSRRSSARSRFWGSNIAFGKLQEIIPGRPISARARPAGRQRRRCCSSPSAARSAIAAGSDRRASSSIGAARVAGAARALRRAADRRRRHAGRDLAAERVHRPVAPPRPASRSTTRR